MLRCVLLCGLSLLAVGCRAEEATTASTPTEAAAESCSLPFSIEGMDFNTSECPPPPSCGEGTHHHRDCDFKIGARGGGFECNTTCASTLKGGKAAIRQGANSLIVPICLSQDNIPFVWRDCDTMSPEAISRRLGRITNGKCAPYIHPDVAGRSAHELTCSEVKSRWGYKSDWTQCTKRQEAEIPTLQEYFQHFQHDEAFLLLRYTGQDSERARKLFWIAQRLAFHAGVHLRVLFAVDSPQLVPAAQCGISSAGGSARHLSVYQSFQLSDLAEAETMQAGLTAMDSKMNLECTTQASLSPATSHFLSSSFDVMVATAERALADQEQAMRLLLRFQPVHALRQLCVFGVFISRPDARGGEAMSQIVMLRALDRRDRNFPHLHIYASGVSRHDELLWLLQHGVDGVETNAVTRTRVTHDTMHHLGQHLNPVPCLAGGYGGQVQHHHHHQHGNATTATPSSVTTEAGPPPFVSLCLRNDGMPTHLYNFNHILRCWIKLLRTWAASRPLPAASAPMASSAAAHDVHTMPQTTAASPTTSGNPE